MTEGVSALQAEIDRLDEAEARCREAAREANATAKALRHATTDAQQVYDRLESLLARVPDRAGEIIEEDMIRAQLEAALAGTVEAIKDHAVNFADSWTSVFVSFIEITLGLRDGDLDVPRMLTDLVEALPDDSSARRRLARGLGVKV